MALGVLPVVLGSPGIAAPGSTLGTVSLLWATLTGTFVLGLGVTIAGVGVTSRGVSKVALLVALSIAAVGTWILDLPVVAYSPYGVFLSPTVPRAVTVLIVITLAFLVGGVTFDVTTRRDARTANPAFRRWRDVIGNPVATKTLLDVHRSSGGFGKVLFSAAVLFGVMAALVDLAGQITGVSPSVGISFGAILGLSGFTTYNWLTQFDDVDSYLVHPLDVSDVFRAKFRAFVVLGPLVGGGFYLLALAWRGSRPVEALVGGVLVVGVACYIFGVTVYLTGLSPNEFLFDTLLFAGFGVAMIVPLVPILVIGFALAPVSAVLLGGVGVGGIAMGAVGVGLYHRAIPKWSQRHR